MHTGPSQYENGEGKQERTKAEVTAEVIPPQVVADEEKEEQRDSSFKKTEEKNEEKERSPIEEEEVRIEVGDHVDFAEAARHLETDEEDYQRSVFAITYPPPQPPPVVVNLRSKPSDTSDYVSDLDSSRMPSRADTFNQQQQQTSASSVPGSEELSFREVVRRLEGEEEEEERKQPSRLISDEDLRVLMMTRGHQLSPYVKHKLLRAANHHHRHRHRDGGKYGSVDKRRVVPATTRKSRSAESINRQSSSSSSSSSATPPSTARNSPRHCRKSHSDKSPRAESPRSVVKSRKLIELPIYSQATWAGPNSRRKRPAAHQELRHQLHTLCKGSEPRLSSLTSGTGTTTSLCGSGDDLIRQTLAAQSLPINVSHLPKELVDKIGGQTDRLLLAPVDQLDFELLCRPLPSLHPRSSAQRDASCGGSGKTPTSKRRLVSEKLRLPPGHSDLEVLSGTYEDQDTGIVSTDL